MMDSTFETLYARAKRVIPGLHFKPTGGGRCRPYIEIDACTFPILHDMPVPEVRGFLVGVTWAVDMVGGMMELSECSANDCPLLHKSA